MQETSSGHLVMCFAMRPSKREDTLSLEGYFSGIVPYVRHLANKALFWADCLPSLERATLIALGVRNISRLSGRAHICTGQAGHGLAARTMLEICKAGQRYKPSRKA